MKSNGLELSSKLFSSVCKLPIVFIKLKYPGFFPTFRIASSHFIARKGYKEIAFLILCFCLLKTTSFYFSVLLSTHLVLMFSDSESQWLFKYNWTNSGGSLASQVVNAGRGKRKMAPFRFANDRDLSSFLSLFFFNFVNHPVITKVIKFKKW